MKASIPKLVAEKYTELKAEYGNIYLSKIGGRFYLYKVSYADQGKAGNKSRTSEYFGRITEQGAFIKKSATKEEKELEKAMAIVKSHGMLLEPQKQNERPIKSGSETVAPTVTEEEAKILTILSMNGRARMKSIGKLLGISAQAATRKVKALEIKYGLKYTAEFDPYKIGFQEYVVLIKFLDKVPTTEELRAAFEPLPMVQLCALVKGEYDVLLYVVADMEIKAGESGLDVLRNRALQNYQCLWYVKAVLATYGFIPTRPQFFEMLADRIWHRRPDLKKPPLYSIFERDYKVLKDLNINGKKSYQDIDKDNGLPQGSARYSYYKMLESGLLKRVTICQTNLPVSYVGIIQFNRLYIPAFQASRDNLRFDVIADDNLVSNRYTAIFNVRDPDGVLLIMPMFRGGNLNKKTDELKSKLKGVEFSNTVITGLIVGDFCYRRFDNSYSMQYENLAREKKIETEKRRIPYSEL